MHFVLILLRFLCISSYCPPPYHGFRAKKKLINSCIQVATQLLQYNFATYHSQLLRRCLQLCLCIPSPVWRKVPFIRGSGYFYYWQTSCVLIQKEKMERVIIIIIIWSLFRSAINPALCLYNIILHSECDSVPLKLLESPLAFYFCKHSYSS